MIAATETWSHTKQKIIGCIQAATQCGTSVVTYRTSYLRQDANLNEECRVSAKALWHVPKFLVNAEPFQRRFTGTQPKERAEKLSWKLADAYRVHLPFAFPVFAAKNIVHLLCAYRHGTKILMLQALAALDGSIHTASWVITMQ